VVPGGTVEPAPAGTTKPPPTGGPPGSGTAQDGPPATAGETPSTATAAASTAAVPATTVPPPAPEPAAPSVPVALPAMHPALCELRATTLDKIRRELDDRQVRRFSELLGAEGTALLSALHQQRVRAWQEVRFGDDLAQPDGGRGKTDDGDGRARRADPDDPDGRGDNDDDEDDDGKSDPD